MFNPMLAIGKPKEWSDEQYLEHIGKHLPLIGQPKLDGFRCLINEHEVPVSRYLKAIRNNYIRAALWMLKLPYGFDGELLTETDGKTDDFNTVSSKVTTREGTPTFYYTVFDWCSSVNLSYETRYLNMEHFIYGGPVKRENVYSVKSVVIQTLEELQRYSAEQLALNFEGIILRKPSSRYKQGRSTINQFYLAKLKPFETSEAIIIGFEELMHNGNNASTDARGYTERSNHQGNLIRGNTLGALVVCGHGREETFNVGTGFDNALRKEIWTNRSKYLGKIITYRFQANRSKLNKPIHPSFVGFRHEDDMKG